MSDWPCHIHITAKPPHPSSHAPPPRRSQQQALHRMRTLSRARLPLQACHPAMPPWPWPCKRRDSGKAEQHKTGPQLEIRNA